MSADANPSSAGHAPKTVITKDNIHSFSYYQLFHLPDPVLDKASILSPGIDVIDAAALTRLYRRYSLLFHPDKDDSPAAREAFEYVKTALETLIDGEKRSEYHTQRRGGVDVDDTARQREQQADADADWAAQILKQREAQQAAAAAARAQAAAEKEEAMRRMQAELTSSLDTPFAMMESEVMREWDVDEGLLDVKRKEVAKLMKELAKLYGQADTEHSIEHAEGGAAAKKQRTEVEV